MDINTLSTVISIFLLLMAGYGAKKAGILRSSDSAVMNTMIIYLTFPALIFMSVHKKAVTGSMVKVPFLLIGVELVVMGLAYLGARLMKLDRRTTGAFILVAAFGNTGFLGYPVVSAVFGHNDQAMMAAVLIDQFGMWILLNTFGAAVAAGFAGSQFEWSNIQDFIKSPLLFSTAIAILFRNITVPHFVTNTLSYLAAGTVPLAMISIGLNLSAGSVKRYPIPVLVVVIFKMMLMPFLIHAMLPMLGVSNMVWKVSMLQSAMPTAAFAGVLSARFGANGPFAAAAIFVTTLASILVIPCLLAII